MKTYTGTYICPYCEEKFSWELIDDGYRGGSYKTEVFIVNGDPTVAKCDIIKTRTGSKIIGCYCTQCQMFVELKDIDNIPKELFV